MEHTRLRLWGSFGAKMVKVRETRPTRVDGHWLELAVEGVVFQECRLFDVFVRDIEDDRFRGGFKK